MYYPGGYPRLYSAVLGIGTYGLMGLVHASQEHRPVVQSQLPAPEHFPAASLV